MGAKTLLDHTTEALQELVIKATDTSIAYNSDDYTALANMIDKLTMLREQLLFEERNNNNGK